MRRKENSPDPVLEGRESEEFTLTVERGHLRLYSRHRERPASTEPVEWSPLFRAEDPEGRALLGKLASNRQLGLYVSGLPGVGKSTLLLHLILEDIRTGTACCVIDPHGDLVNAVLERCPPDPGIREPILVFDPADVERPVGLDILDVATEREQELAVQFMLGLYEELFLREHQGPILHQSFANGLRLLMEQDRSLAELPLLFTDRGFLEKRTAECTNPWVRHYFTEVWPGIRGSSDGGEYMGYFTSKIARFVDDPMLRNILAQKKGSDLAGHLNNGGVVLANLARGAVGDVNARLLGMILLHKLERIAMARASLEPGKRPPLHVYVDEFHELVTPSLARFLGAGRKFNVGLTLAHQRLETLPSGAREALLGAVGHYALFRQASGAGLRELTGLLWPRFGTRELLGAGNYQGFLRVTVSDGEAAIGRLSVPAPAAGSPDVARVVRVRSRRRFGRSKASVEREILCRLGWTE